MDSTMVAMTSADYSGPVSPVGPSSGNKPAQEPAAMECESWEICPGLRIGSRQVYIISHHPSFWKFCRVNILNTHQDNTTRPLQPKSSPCLSLPISMTLKTLHSSLCLSAAPRLQSLYLGKISILRNRTFRCLGSNAQPVLPAGSSSGCSQGNIALDVRLPVKFS